MHSHHSTGKSSSHGRRNHSSSHILSHEFNKILRSGFCQKPLVSGYSAIIPDDIASDNHQIRILSQNIQNMFFDQGTSSDMHDSIREGDEEFISSVGIQRSELTMNQPITSP